MIMGFDDLNLAQEDGSLPTALAGLGTVTVATEAETGLLDARLAKADAHAASLIAAANLAFAVGAMTSSDSCGGCCSSMDGPA